MSLLVFHCNYLVPFLRYSTSNNGVESRLSSRVGVVRCDIAAGMIPLHMSSSTYIKIDIKIKKDSEDCTSKSIVNYWSPLH